MYYLLGFVIGLVVTGFFWFFVLSHKEKVFRFLDKLFKEVGNNGKKD